MRVTTPQLLDALAQHLADHDCAVFDPSGVYTANVLPGAVFGQLPPNPDLLVAINRYDTNTTRDDHNPDVYVQLLWRASKHPHHVEQCADRAFDLLHWSENHGAETWPGGVRVLISRRVVAAPATTDVTGRYQRADSYRITINPVQE